MAAYMDMLSMSSASTTSQVSNTKHTTAYLSESVLWQETDKREQQKLKIR
jgi:hypothetical protein